MFKLLIIFFTASTLLLAKVDITLSTQKLANAQTILVRVKPGLTEALIDKSYVAFEGVRYPCYVNIFDAQESYYALVPTNYHMKPQKSRLVVVYVQNGKKHYRSFMINIIKGKYKSEKLKVASSRAVISAKNKIRITKEAQEAKKIYQTKTAQLYANKPFILPMKTKITSSFGTKRVFNGVLKSYHSGTDFRALVGTPIRATNDGVVVLAKNRFFAGNSVIIDHGEGIYTGYYHLNKIKVKVGAYVSQGDIIGLAGATGRVTGPHLHFSANIHAVQVDPMYFLKTFNLLSPL